MFCVFFFFIHVPWEQTTQCRIIYTPTLFLRHQTITLDKKQGDPKEFTEVVENWCTFYNSLLDCNSNKRTKPNHSIFLQFNRYAHEKAFCGAKHKNRLRTEARTTAIAAATDTLNLLTVVSNVQITLNILLSTNRTSHESFKNIESRFVAQLFRFNPFSSKATIQEAKAFLILLANALV